jgi:hypothetical protein
MVRAADRRALHAASYWSGSFIAFVLPRKNCSINSRRRIYANSLRDREDRPLTRDPRPSILTQSG